MAIQSVTQWHGDTSLSVSGVRYDLQHEPDPVAGRLRLYKTRSMIEHYEPIVAEFQGANIVELGIFGGGSTAYFAQRCGPRRMVAIEISTERVGSLDEMLADRGLDHDVRLHYGVDQGDRARLHAIADEAFGDEPLDLVIDDASHVYGPTRASFEVLFPRLRPGGLYVIEDWRSQDWFIRMFAALVHQPRSEALRVIEANLARDLLDPDAVDARVFERWCTSALLDPRDPDHEAVAAWYESLDAVPAIDASGAGAAIAGRLRAVLAAGPDAGGPSGPQPPTMGTLAAELCMGMKSGHPALAEVDLTPHWIAARRGSQPVDPATFTVDAIAADPFAILAPHTPGA